MPELTPALITELVGLILTSGSRRELDAIGQQIARDYAATPEQVTANEPALGRLRHAITIRRSQLGRSDPRGRPV